MEYIDIKRQQEKIHIPIVRKKMKHVRLRVYPNGEVKISAPYGTSYTWINDYIKSKSDWINAKLDNFKQTNRIEAITEIKNGTTIRLFGKDYFALIICENNKVVRKEENRITISTPDISNQIGIYRQLESWLKKQLQAQLIKKIDELYPIIKKHGILRPEYKIRKMKTMWGSCNIDKKIITINYYIYQAQLSYIEYVVLHELIHFIHRNHNKDFYAMLSLYMPNWKERKNYLDHEIMQSIRI